MLFVASFSRLSFGLKNLKREELLIQHRETCLPVNPVSIAVAMSVELVSRIWTSAENTLFTVHIYRNCFPRTLLSKMCDKTLPEMPR